jgi:hypothetical protein
MVRRLLGWTAPELARKIRADLSSLDDLVAGEFILFNSYITCGLAPPISSFFFLLLEEFGLQLQHLTPHSILLVSVFVHFMDMFMGVRPCITICKHFYFQLKHGMSSSYISAFSSAKWEDWRTDWVIAMTDANDRLELPTRGPLLDRNSWKARPSLPAELDPVLDRVKVLARGCLTLMMVLGDFLRRRIAPLQQRSRMVCMFTGVNDCSRIERGAGMDLSDAELEVLIRGMIGEAYALELLVLPRGINALCEDQGMRMAIQASLPTLDDGGLAVRQVRGDPNRGIQIPGASPNSPRHVDPNSDQSSHGAPAPSGRGKEPEVASSRSSEDHEEDRSRRLRRGDGSFVGEPNPKHQKTTES